MSKSSRLRWLCRRGMKELDLLLINYLEKRYPSANPAEQQAFEQLLEMADPDLYTLITGKTRSDDAQVMRVVEVMRRTLAQ
jgi:antitoxin CptB